jgi:quinol monooxygenase YgiN
MWARVTRRTLAGDELDGKIKAYQTEIAPYVTSQKGNIGALVMVDRNANEILAISMWEDEASMLASSGPVRQLVNTAAEGHRDFQNLEIVVKK